MIKDIRKASGTFAWTQFLQGVTFKIHTWKHMFCSSWHINNYREHVRHVFLCRKLISKLCVLFRKCHDNFLSEIAPKCSLGRLQMQKRVAVQLKGECFAPPSAMNYENALSWADSGMGVGSPTSGPSFLKILQNTNKNKNKKRAIAASPPSPAYASLAYIRKEPLLLRSKEKQSAKRGPRALRGPFGPPEEKGRRRVLCTTSFCAAARRNAWKLCPRP